eukprot:5558-Heterococcus_DN1.PRE.5
MPGADSDWDWRREDAVTALINEADIDVGTSDITSSSSIGGGGTLIDAPFTAFWRDNCVVYVDMYRVPNNDAVALNGALASSLVRCYCYFSARCPTSCIIYTSNDFGGIEAGSQRSQQQAAAARLPYTPLAAVALEVALRCGTLAPCLSVDVTHIIADTTPAVLVTRLPLLKARVK